MALQPFSNNGYAYLDNVYQGQQQSEYVGMSGLSTQVGPFYIGFDSRLKPAMSRIFFDPTLVTPIPTRSAQFIGLMQIGQITYQGIPIPPSVYGMGLDYLDSYIPPTDHPMFNSMRWAAMMTPAEATHLDLPLFQWNGWLRNPSYTAEDFFNYPMPNGSFTTLPLNVQGPNGTSFTSSLTDAIDLDIDSPPLAVITTYIQNLIGRGAQPIASGTYTQQQVLAQTPLGLAFQLLLISDYNTVESVEVNGPYMLITMVDVEGDGPMYAAFFDSRGELVIYEIDLEEFEELRFDALTNTFYRIQQYLLQTNQIPKRGFPADPPLFRAGKGGNGLNPFPFMFQGFQYNPMIDDEDEFGPEIAFNYRTFAIGATADISEVVCYGGVGWRVSRIFDPSVLEFGDVRFSEPYEIKFDTTMLNYVLKGQAEPIWSDEYQIMAHFRQIVKAPPVTGSTNPTLFENTSNTTGSPQGYNPGSQNWISR